MQKSSIPNHIDTEDSLHMPSSPPETTLGDDEAAVGNGAEEEPGPDPTVTDHQDGPDAVEPEEQATIDDTPTEDPSGRLQAMQDERDSLKAEVTRLRQSLESLQERHNVELTGAREALSQSEQRRERAETQYNTLHSRVNTIRSQLGDRLREDQGKIEALESDKQELESANNGLKQDNARLQGSISDLNARVREQEAEIENLRSRTTLSTSNWSRERDDLEARIAQITEEYEVAKEAMQDWEILANEERTKKEALDERTQEIEEQLIAAREAYERVRSEAESQSSTVDGLQRALRDVQEERKRELREMVEQSQAQLEQLRTTSKAAEDAEAECRKQLEDTKKELERLLPLEKEIKEKNLLLGKTRHEAVVLNEHLVRALRLLKRGKPEDNVDRNLVTNYLIQYLGLERSDTKRFQILQLIAALLGWNEEQKEKAGLQRQGSQASGSLSIPLSPFRRTPSTPSLSTDFTPESPAGATKESLAELWSEFLEREAEGARGAGSSRRGSVATNARSPSVTSVTSPIGGPAGRKSPDMKRKESTSTNATQKLG